MITPMQNAVIYCRVSTKEQVEEGNSLVTQEKVCREFAERNNYKITEVFIEQGESAKTQDRRELQRMIEYCSQKKNQIDAVIAYKIDRISRNTDDYSQIRLLLKRNGVEIKSTSEQFENTPVGRFLENTLASIAEFDNSIRAERCSNGMKEAVREGRYVWMAPIGYKNVRVVGKATIAQSELAPVIRETFELIAQGQYPVDEIRKMMYAKGLMNLQGKPIARAYFYRLIKNRLYAGIIEKFGESHKGNFTPIITEKLFNHVQHVLKNKGRGTITFKRDRVDFPLRRFIQHPSGTQLTGYWAKGANGKKYRYYRYASIRKASYPADRLEHSFYKLFDSCSMSDIERKELVRQLRFIYDEKTYDQKKEKELLNKRLQEIEQREGLIIEKNLKGIIPDDIAKNQLSLLKDEAVDIHSQLYAIGTIGIDVQSVLCLADKFLKKPSVFWHNADLVTKLQLQKFAFPKGIVFDGEEMQTPEIAMVFKAKKEFLEKKSPLVDYKLLYAKRFMAECEVLEKIIQCNPSEQ